MQITFLVGNGFDITAGLDTSYSAFYKWYCQQTPFSQAEDVPVAVTSDDPQNKEKTLALL